MNPRSFFISIGLHLGIAVLALVGLPSLNRPLPEDQPLVTMEIVQTVPQTNVKEGSEVSTAKQAQQAAQRKIPPPPPPPKPAPAAPKAVDTAAEINPEKIQEKPKPAEAQ